jgi:SAM-dependent methyltransferase
MRDGALREFYERGYTHGERESARFGAWRALGARAKADHVVQLCARAGVEPSRTLEIGCGDGALLCELGRRDFGGRLYGVEISRAAVQIADAREEISSVTLYDGEHMPADDGAFELGILSHVLEHVADPCALLAEAARTCRAVMIEVPLEANLSARRRSRRGISADVGHIQRFNRAAVLGVVRRAGLRVVAEMEDPLPLAVHLFGARTRAQRARAVTKWAVRASAHGAAPAIARRVFTVHYASLCVARA